MGSKEKNMDLTSTENEAVKKVKKADKWADKPAMEVRDLHFSYGKNKVLKGVSLKIEEGKITTIMGANGCCKSKTGRSPEITGKNDTVTTGAGRALCPFRS